MLLFIPSLLLVLLLASPALLTPSNSRELQVRGQRTPREAKQDSIKVVISEGCATHGDSSDVSQGDKEINLTPGSPLVLTHKIKLVPSSSGSGSCGCEADLAALRERLERLEREVSDLREKCGGPEGNCCTSKESKGPGCSIKPETDECPNECSDQGRCVDGKCVCFPGFSGPDCSQSNCPGNCNDNGRCVNGQCVCDPGFTGPDCSQRACPDNCSNRGRCVNGRCVCDGGFTGPSCSDKSCPGNCNNRGRCINGLCVCDDGFTGLDCLERTCPNDCSDHGRCVNGQCVCDSGFTGDDCSENSCPGNCNNRGRCINGQCVCDDGVTGADCSEKACPNNCNNRGKCVNGKCVCNVGFAGPDCAAKGCPNNCNNKGRCVKGSCVCRRGFTGPDCSQCQEGMTGPNCDIVMSGVSQLSAQDITETSVTLVWTPPPVQYETYHITFTSQKESDQQITVQAEGSLTTFTQTGLAAGQEYSVSIVGEMDGKRGAESSTEFMTLLSGPTNLQVVKTTSTSAVVQWEQSQGEIDRYRLTVTPNDGAGRSRDMTIPAGQNSAHIRQLEAGRLYDITLVAEKGTSRSEPATTQAVPGEALPRVTTAALTMQVTLAPGQDVGGMDQDLNQSPEVQVFDRQGRREDGSEAGSVKVRAFDGPDKDSSASVIGRTKPLSSKMMPINGTRSKLAGRPVLSRRVPGLRSNATRVVPGGKRFVPGPLKKAPVVAKKKEQLVPKKLKPGVTVGDQSIEASDSERRGDKNPVMMSGPDSETNSKSSSEEPTAAVGSREQPNFGMAGHGNHTDPASPEPTRTVQSQEKKCMNKVKVTHFRLPHKNRGNGCRGDGTGQLGKSDPGFPSRSDTLLSGETDLDNTPDPLHKLLTDTFDSLNITTFSVHLTKQSDLSHDADTVRMQILRGLKPLSTFSSSSSSSQSSSHSSISESSSSSSSSLDSPSPDSSASTAAPSSSLKYFISSVPSSRLQQPRYPNEEDKIMDGWMGGLPSSLQSLPSSAPSSSLSITSSSDNSDSLGSNGPDVDNSKSTADCASPEKCGVPPVLAKSPKRVFVRRPHPYLNKTRLNLRLPQRPPPRLNLIPTRQTETRHLSKSGFLSSPSSSSSEESNSDEVNAPVKDTSGEKDVASTPASSEVEQNQKIVLTERRRIPVRRLLPKRGRPFVNVGPLQNRTRPNLRVLTRPSQPVNPETEMWKEQGFPTALPITSSPSTSKDSHPSDTEPVGKENEGREGTRISTSSLSTEFNQTLRGSGVPPSHRPNTRVGYFRHPPLQDGSLQNKTRTNLRPPHYSRRGPVRKPFPTRKQNVTIGSQTSQLGKDSTPENPENRLVEQDIHRPSQGVKLRQSGEQETAEVTPSAQFDAPTTSISPQTKELAEGDNDLNQRRETSATDADIHKEITDAGENTGATVRGRPTFKQTSSYSRPSRPLPKRQPPARTTTSQHHTQMGHYISGSQKEDDPNTNRTARRVFDSKTEQTRSTATDVSSSGVSREPLDFVGVTNRTSDGFTLIWDSPEGKYKNFVVTRKEAGKDEEPKPKEGNQEQVEDPDKEGGSEAEKGKNKPMEETESGNGNPEDDNRVPESFVSQVPRIPSSAVAKPTENDKTFKKVLPGAARSILFEDLPPQTDYTLTLLGNGPGLLSRLHKLVISTGPEPPSNIVFSKVTENSLTVSWTKPKSPVSGFKVTYTHADDGEPVSVSVDSEDSTLGLSQLSPGSSYEVTIISTLGLDESDPVKDFIMTLPDPPTDLQAVNVTDTTALLLWRPALAAVDKYAIVYGPGTDSELRITVSGNAAEQQLSGLEGSTTYTVTITSQLGSLESSPATTSFTTSSGSRNEGEGPRDLQASNVTPRTAMLSWKPPLTPAGSYRLTYQTEGQEMKEVIVDAMLTQYNLTRLHPGSTYTVQLQAEAGGRYTSAISTEFTTGTLRFPFPTDCSQELLNGILTSGEVEIFPQGKLGTPMMVYCDMETEGGGWTVFQRRKDGSVDFYRGWKDYTKGFGDPSGEFWLGLDSLHNLTTMTRMTLRVDMRDGDESVFAQYSTFEVAKRNYKLIVGGYTGTAGDSLSYHNNRIFSTKDRDPAPFITRCAMSYRGGWWYKNCHEANLNGVYGIEVKHQGVIWTSWKGKEFSIPFTEMKMRPAAFRPPARG